MVRQANEDRKLNHRLQVADHLRQNAERNGNANLLSTADRMEQRAYDHYDQRLSQMGIDNPLTDDPLQQPVTPPAENAFQTFQAPESFREPSLDERPSSLGTMDDSFSRHLANEDRKLNHQLDVAQQLRDIADRNGNPNLLQTADRMEQMALNRYERAMEHWTADHSAVDAITSPMTSAGELTPAPSPAGTDLPTARQVLSVPQTTARQFLRLIRP
ncbi:hypothetical protein FYK55_18585 [Roseiconus nitratireducens]|uniref:Uncharacterized protein n=1 Tax=Roseiconus nitratireducens TaxID=2605748 RepID=A0A5M6D0W3_9BACT|nr:hypothetical protein [Roseiconus nitratireducens]KAA5540923.1 hypothetical protein FYK55_18585 [Roseiconus nitratireducens]